MRLAILVLASFLGASAARSETAHQIRFVSEPVVLAWEEPGGRFAVASNTGFEIVAESSAASLAASGFTINLAETRPNAAASGVTLRQAVASGVVVYRSEMRTAIAPGAPETQALVFAAAWDRARLPDGLRLTARPIKSGSGF